MTDLSTRVAEWVAFDERDTHAQAIKMDYDSNRPREHKAFEYGSRSERARTAELDALWPEVVEVLDWYWRHWGTSDKDIRLKGYSYCEQLQRKIEAAVTPKEG